MVCGGGSFSGCGPGPRCHRSEPVFSLVRYPGRCPV